MWLLNFVFGITYSAFLHILTMHSKFLSISSIDGLLSFKDCIRLLTFIPTGIVKS